MVVIKVIVAALVVVMLAALGLASTDSRLSDPLAVALALLDSVQQCTWMLKNIICQGKPVSA